MPSTFPSAGRLAISIAFRDFGSIRCVCVKHVLLFSAYLLFLHQCTGRSRGVYVYALVFPRWNFETLVWILFLNDKGRGGISVVSRPAIRLGGEQLAPDTAPAAFSFKFKMVRDTYTYIQPASSISNLQKSPIFTTQQNHNPSLIPYVAMSLASDSPSSSVQS